MGKPDFQSSHSKIQVFRVQQYQQQEQKNFPMNREKQGIHWPAKGRLKSLVYSFIFILVLLEVSKCTHVYNAHRSQKRIPDAL